MDFRQPPSLVHPRKHQMTKHPTAKVMLQSVAIDYGATFFKAALSCFIVQYQHPHDVLTVVQLETAASDIMIPFQKVSVFHHIKYTKNDRYSITEPHPIVNSVHAQPSRRDKWGNRVPGWFDMVLVNIDNGKDVSVQGAFTMIRWCSVC